MAAYSVDLTSATPLSKDGAPVAALDVHVEIALSKRVSISNPLGELQTSFSLAAHVDDSGQSPRPQHAPEHVMRSSNPSDTLALVPPIDPIPASVGPASFALNSATAIP